MALVTVENMMDQINADDDERPFITIITQNAISAISIAVGRDFNWLTPDEQNIFNSAVLILGGKMYFNRDDTATEQQVSMLDNIISLIRIPQIGILGGTNDNSSTSSSSSSGSFNNANVTNNGDEDYEADDEN
ncbi:MAG: head-tail connector protein [Acinetobacter baumannii]